MLDQGNPDLLQEFFPDSLEFLRSLLMSLDKSLNRTEHPPQQQLPSRWITKGKTLQVLVIYIPLFSTEYLIVYSVMNGMIPSSIV